MDIKPYIFNAKVMHKRLFPKVNKFTYRVYYVVLPIEKLSTVQGLTIDKPAWMNFRIRDYGPRDGSDLAQWGRALLKQYGLNEITKHLMLITMPRILGYGFNPASFWLCLDDAHQIRAVISEVHNTFGEAHSYLCAHSDHSPITGDEWLKAEKLFHVSPFLPREGTYEFRFTIQEGKVGVWIDYSDAKGNKQLLTSLVGHLEPLNASTLRRAFWTHPLVTLKTITLIHWQALKLFAKGVRYIVKPEQHSKNQSISENLTKV